MRRVKQISIKSYITFAMLSVLLILSAIMLLFVNILANEAIAADIQTELVNEARQNSRALIYADGRVQITEDFVFEEDDRHFLVVDRNGIVLYGEYPTELSDLELAAHLPAREEVITGRLHLLEFEEGSYYLVDVISARITRQLGHSIYIRCLVRQSAISSKYQFIRMISYISIPIMVFVAVGFSLLFAKSFLDPIKQLREVAENISCDDDLSYRTEYHGHFYEIAVLSEANNRMLETLEKSFEIQKQFNSDVAHELRNPIAIVLAQCEYAKNHIEDTDNYQETLDIIYRQTKKEDRMVHQLLKLSRLEQKHVVLEREWANLDDIIQSVCEDEEQKAENGIEIRQYLEEINAYIDVTMLTMVVQNLIHNAIAYSTSPAAIEIRTATSDDEVQISVTDNGCGIEKENLEKIFHPFFRVDKARNSEGVGLGLAISTQIVELHGGTISVESQVGAGSTFTVRLPIENESF